MEQMTPIQKIQELISNRYIGKCGIHGTGIRKGRIAIYLDKENNPNQETVLKSIRELCHPFHVVIVRCDQPELENEIE